MIKLKGIMLISTQANGFPGIPGIPGIPCMSLAVASCCVSLYSHLSTSHTPSLYSGTPVMYAIHCALTVTGPGHQCMLDIRVCSISLYAGHHCMLWPLYTRLQYARCRCMLDFVCWTSLYARRRYTLGVAMRSMLDISVC